MKCSISDTSYTVGISVVGNRSGDSRGGESRIVIHSPIFIPHLVGYFYCEVGCIGDVIVQITGLEIVRPKGGCGEKKGRQKRKKSLHHTMVLAD